MKPSTKPDQRVSFQWDGTPLTGIVVAVPIGSTDRIVRAKEDGRLYRLPDKQLEIIREKKKPEKPLLPRRTMRETYKRWRGNDTRDTRKPAPKQTLSSADHARAERGDA